MESFGRRAAPRSRSKASSYRRDRLLGLQEGISGLVLEIDHVSWVGSRKLKIVKGPNRPMCSPARSGPHVDGHGRQRGGLGEAVALLPHCLWPADWTAQHCLVENSPNRRRVVLCEEVLPNLSYPDPLLDVLGGEIWVHGLEDRPGVDRRL